MSDDAVWRVLRKDGVQLRRHRSWFVSTDPQFAAKAADIIGLYLSPPESALVLSIDENPTIQALERAKGYVQTSSGKIVHGTRSTYKRHGTINLFAALNVATGIIQGKITQTKKRIDFQAFLDDVVADLPPDPEIHVILGNLCTHMKNNNWLAAHPNVDRPFYPDIGQCEPADKVLAKCRQLSIGALQGRPCGNSASGSGTNSRHAFLMVRYVRFSPPSDSKTSPVR